MHASSFTDVIITLLARRQRQPDALDKEVQYVQQKLLRCPYNESAWSFLSGLQSLWPSPDLPCLQKTLAEFSLEVRNVAVQC